MTSHQVDDSKFYLAATKEFDSGRRNAQIWAKAIALEKGDERQARYIYIQLRARQFARVAAEAGRREREVRGDTEKERDPLNSSGLRGYRSEVPIRAGRAPESAIAADQGILSGTLAALRRAGSKPATGQNPQRPRDDMRPTDEVSEHEFLGTWNWGAALLPFVWGAFNATWGQWMGAIAAIILLPLIGNIIVGIVFGLHGNRWAWSAREWISVEDFIETQRKWEIAAFVVVPFAVIVILSVG